MALNLTLRKVYLYLFAIIGLIVVIIGAVQMIDLGLKTYVFKKSDYPCYQTVPVAAPDKTSAVENLTTEQANIQKQQCEEQRTSDKQRQASIAMAQLIVGLPLYLYHWMLIKKENQV